MKLRKNPREALRKFIHEAEEHCKAWMNSTQQYTELVKVTVKAATKQRSIESVASQSSRTASPDTIITNAKLELEGDIENALLDITEFVKRLNYLAMRALAESLSQHLQIPFHDEFSSFDEEIYARKSYSKRFETIEVLKLDFPERFELHTVENSRIISFPTFINKPAVIILSVTAIILTAVFVLLLFLNNSNIIIIIIVAFLYATVMLFIFLFAIFFICSTSKDRITLNDGSIMLTRRHLWGTSEVFVSNLEELQEVTTFPYSTSALLLFRSVKKMSFTYPHQKQDIIQVFHTLNRLLFEKGKGN